MFTRRRLQAMIDELAGELGTSKTLDIIKRLESKEIEQALPAQMELALIWAIASLGDGEIEPGWFGASSLPDAYSERLVPGRPCVVEIAALSDAALPGDVGMRTTSRKLSHEAGRIRKGAAAHLSYFFYEENNYVGGKSLRRVIVPRDFQLTPRLQSLLGHWVREQRADGDELRLQDVDLDVIVKWNDRPQSRYNYRSSMPPEIRSLDDNYLFGALRRKARQLRSELFEGLRCVILADVGSSALRDVRKVDYSNRVFNGAQIIDAFLRQDRPGLDVVAVLSANRSRPTFTVFDGPIEWDMTTIQRPGLDLDLTGFKALVHALPPPRIAGHLARQLHEQGAYAPSRRGRYVGSTISGGFNKKMQVKFSARVLLDVLAGREKPERITEIVGPTPGANFFKAKLDGGQTISTIRFESGGIDEDDDWIVLEFSDDPAARPLRQPN